MRAGKRACWGVRGETVLPAAYATRVSACAAKSTLSSHGHMEEDVPMHEMHLVEAIICEVAVA